MGALHVVFGIGNPGREYDGTRHNVGFEVVDALAAAARRPLRKFKGLAARGTGIWVRRCPVLLVEPLTYVNRCGPVLQEIRAREGVPVERILVVVDDLDLPVGRLRLRGRGSDGGHNGLRSLTAHLQTDRFPRLRVGIGDRGGRPGAHYVLERFGPAERPVMDRAVRAAAGAVVAWAADGIERAMSRINRRDLDQPGRRA